MFFDAYPRFYETGTAGAYRDRLNLRYEGIFAENRDIFRGARVLDIASHDGRWSLAALKTGAAEVIGIEAREKLVSAARENLRLYCGDEAPYRFIAGDVFDVLSRETFEADVVLCLGFLYHTLRYNELLSRVRDINPRHLIIDTIVLSDEMYPRVGLFLDSCDKDRNAFGSSYSHRGQMLVGRPSVPALRLMVQAYDFEIERFSDWGAIFRDNPSISRGRHYAQGRRVTARCVSKI